MIAIRPSKKSRAPMMIMIQPANPIQPAHAVDLDVAVDAVVATVAPFVLPACHNVDSAPRRHLLSDGEMKGRVAGPRKGGGASEGRRRDPTLRGRNFPPLTPAQGAASTPSASSPPGAEDSEYRRRSLGDGDVDVHPGLLVAGDGAVELVS